MQKFASVVAGILSTTKMELPQLSERVMGNYGNDINRSKC